MSHAAPTVPPTTPSPLPRAYERPAARYDAATTAAYHTHPFASSPVPSMTATPYTIARTRIEERRVRTATRTAYTTPHPEFKEQWQAASSSHSYLPDSSLAYPGTTTPNVMTSREFVTQTGTSSCAAVAASCPPHIMMAPTYATSHAALDAQTLTTPHPTSDARTHTTLRSTSDARMLTSQTPYTSPADFKFTSAGTPYSMPPAPTTPYRSPSTPLASQRPSPASPTVPHSHHFAVSAAARVNAFSPPHAAPADSSARTAHAPYAHSYYATYLASLPYTPPHYPQPPPMSTVPYPQWPSAAGYSHQDPRPPQAVHRPLPPAFFPPTPAVQSLSRETFHPVSRHEAYTTPGVPVNGSRGQGQRCHRTREVVGASSTAY